MKSKEILDQYLESSGYFDEFLNKISHFHPEAIYLLQMGINKKLLPLLPKEKFKRFHSCVNNVETEEESKVLRYIFEIDKDIV